MKTALHLTLTIAALLWLSACSGSRPSPQESLSMAETALQSGHTLDAQQIADSLAADSDYSHMSTTDLCRLSLLFVKLSEHSGSEETNAAMAARTLAAAMERDSDSTYMFISDIPVDDRAGMAIIQAINNACHGLNIDGDTVYFDTDSIF